MMPSPLVASSLLLMDSNSPQPLLEPKYLNYGVRSNVVTTGKGSKELPSEQEAECTRTAITGVCLCPLEGIIHTVSRKWTLQIVTLIGNHQRLRYSDLQKLCAGISPTVLSDRLKDLEEEGIISRRVFAEIPPRVEYSLTKEGVELRELIVPLMNWASKRCA